MRILVSVLALAVATSAVHAADLIIQEPAVGATSVSGLRGVVEVGGLGTYVNQNDDDFADWAGGAYASAALWGSAGGLVWGIDGYVDRNSFSDVYYEAPMFVGVVGGHLGFDTGSGTIGGFASAGFAPDYNNETRGGYTVGIEGVANLSNISIFGQVGYADIRTDGTDNGFTGPFGRVGAVFALSDDMALMADLSAGSTPDFEDEGDEGTFLAAGVKAAFALPTDFASFLTLGYEYAHYSAIEDENNGFSHTFKVGLSIPFGDGNTAADALNPLATSALPYRAASWAATLD